MEVRSIVELTLKLGLFVCMNFSLSPIPLTDRFYRRSSVVQLSLIDHLGLTKLQNQFQQVTQFPSDSLWQEY